ncbi:response regulator [Hydrogenophaga sp. PML113]|uniref:response regulator n=1 Tax=Hydrogenophaga sp. PML113 TaxID=1899350 RepID=UPI000878BA25|nr:response regulator [Hydrogenophaga sp. PML113]
MTVTSVQGNLPQLLLVEPDNMVRSTVASVCRGLDLAQVHQAASLAIGQQMLQAQRMDALLLSLAEGEAAVALIERLREARPEMPVSVMTASADADTVRRLKALGIRRLLLQPFKIRDVVMTVEALCAIAPLEVISGS